MRESLQAAKEKLIERFVDAYNEWDEFSVYKTKTVNYRYASSFSYSLKDYKGRILPGSKVSNVPPVNKEIDGKYGFNNDGFLTTAEVYASGEIHWEGFFKKEADLIEYIEFDAVSKVPSCVQRIVLNDGKKVLFQSCSTNGRGGFYDKGEAFTSNAEIVRHGFNDGHTAICTIEEYIYVDGRIDRAYGLYIMPGTGERSFEDVYKYVGSKLIEIKSYYENSDTNIKYVAPSKKSLSTLTGELANKLSEYLTSVLQKYDFGSPLFSAELSYQYCYTYWPCLVVITEEQRDKAIEQKDDQLFTDGEFIFANSEIPSGLEEQYAEFYQRLETTENWEAGRKMLKQVALLMTTSKLKGLIAVTDDFIVYPIEWIMEGQELEKILLRCGAKKEHIKEWKKYGWV